MGKFTLTDDAKEDLKAVKAYSLTQWGAVITRAYLQGMRVAMQMLANLRSALTSARKPGRACFTGPTKVITSIFFVRLKVSGLSRLFISRACQTW